MKKNSNKKLLLLAVAIIIVLAIYLYKMFFQTEDVSPYDEYVNNSEAISSVCLLYNQNEMVTLDKVNIKERDKNDKLTVEIAKKILGHIDLDDNQRNDINSIIENNNENELTKSTWKETLLKLSSYLDNENQCVESNLSVFSTSSNDSSLKKYEIVTDLGRYIVDGYDTSKLCDKTINVLVRNGSAIFISSVDKDSAKYTNLYIKSCEGEKVVVYLQGSERTFNISGLNRDVSSTIADITVKKGKVSGLSLKRDKITGKIIAVDDNGIEIQGFSKISFSKTLRVYKDNEINENCSIKDIIIGDETAEFIVAGKEICAVYIKSKFNVQAIRVLLKSNGFKDYYHDNVTFKCSSDFSLVFSKETDDNQTTEYSHEYAADQIVTIDPNNEILQYSRIRIIPKDKNAKTSISSINRGYGTPNYRGIIEIALMEGKIVLINELSIEEYLYAVVPSEMPSSYGVEALKVQAVCARSYALSHLNNNKLSRFGAHVDDSTDFQVYNNSEETENSIKAVDDTANLVLKYDGNIANTFFYATSCGSTTDGTIWGGGDIPYVKGKLLQSQGENLDLLNNDVFTQFIKQNYQTFDSEYGWYRWNVTISDDKLTNGINNVLASMYNSNKSQVLTLENGEYVSKPINSIGKLVNLSIVQRGSGGIIEEMIISGTQNSVKIIKQANIRKIINPYGCCINKNDGSSVDTFSSMPSAFFTFDRTADNLGYTFYGGGYGHGAGMSQTAVKSMVNAGMSYDQILLFFYTGVTIESY